jgi:hypothetical protein
MTLSTTITYLHSSTTSPSRAGRSDERIPTVSAGEAVRTGCAHQTEFVAFADRDRCPNPARHDEPNQSSSTRHSGGHGRGAERQFLPDRIQVPHASTVRGVAALAAPHP